MTTRTKARQRAETTAALLSHARRMFAQHGYSDVSLSDIVAAAGVTKGALYHHFNGKADLFRAVVEAAQREVGERVAAAAEAHADAWEQLLAGCREFLAAGSEPWVRRILLVDAPAVLGWHEWRQMDERHSARHLKDAVAGLIEDGTLPAQPVEPVTRLLSGAMNEAALWLADSGDEADHAAVDATLTRMLTALRA